MKTLTRQDRLWVERGMALRHWLKNLFEAIGRRRRHGAHQREHPQDHAHTHWQAPVH